MLVKRAVRNLFSVFSRLSITFRIASGSIAVLAAISIAGAIGIDGVSRTASDTSALYLHAVVGMKGLMGVQSRAMGLQIAVKDAVADGRAGAAVEFQSSVVGMQRELALISRSYAGPRRNVERLQKAVGLFQIAAQSVRRVAHQEGRAAAEKQLGNVERARFKAVGHIVGRMMNSLDRHAHATVSQSVSSKQRVILLLELLLAANVVAAVFVGIGALAGMARPLGLLRDTMERLCNGERDVPVPALDLHDEIGAMARTLRVFEENMAEAERLRAAADEQRQRDAAEQSRRSAEAERARADQEAAKEREHAEAERRRIEAEQRTSRLTDLIRGFEDKVSAVIDTVVSASQDLRTTAERMSDIAGETARQAGAVDAASSQTMDNIQMVTVASDQLSAAISEIGRQVTLSTEVAHKAVGNAGSSAEQIRTLAERVKKIGGVVDLIREIAAQTNLLALNATIEAARAGEAGKGFSVVASEVKNLANETAKATEQVASEIGGVQGGTGLAVTAMDGIRATIDEISQSATAIASAIEEQGAATREIARSVDSAAYGTRDVTDNIQGVTRGAQETGAASKDVLAAAGGVAEQADALRREVAQFLGEVRAISVA